MTKTSSHNLFPDMSAPPSGALFADADAAAPAPPQPTFDSARQDWPSIGLAIYALDPDGPVTLEVHSNGDVYRFDAATAEEALMLAFPPQTGDVFD